jgi:hypothetical protein
MATPFVLTQEFLRAELAELKALAEEKAAARAAGQVDPWDLFCDSYDVYLASKFWKAIKKRVMTRDKGLCQCCGGKGKTVHHRSYEAEVMRGEADEFLGTICDGCHDIVHFDDAGNKRTDAEADAIFCAGIRATDFPEPTVDLRRPWYKCRPRSWYRMTALQQALWRARYEQIAEAKRAGRRAAD